MAIHVSRPFFIVVFGVFCCVNMHAMHRVTARVLLAGARSSAKQKLVPGVVQRMGYVSDNYNPEHGDEAVEGLRYFSESVREEMFKKHVRNLGGECCPGISMGSVIRDSLVWAKKRCKERDDLLQQYKKWAEQDTPIARAECGVLEESLRKRDAELVSTREKLVKEWTTLVLAIERNKKLGRIADQLERIGGLHGAQHGSGGLRDAFPNNVK